MYFNDNVQSTFTCLTFDDVTDDVTLPLGCGRSTFLAENEAHIYPNMCAKFGCGPTVVSKKRGVQTDRQRDTAALYSRLASYPASLGRGRWREGGRGGGTGEREGD